VRFPNNARLTGLFATLNNALFFVDNFRRRIETTVEKISSTDVPVEAVQESGEDLSEFLGLVLDAKERGLNKVQNLGQGRVRLQQISSKRSTR